MSEQKFIRCHRCRKLKGCDLGYEDIMTCGARGCTKEKRKKCILEMQKLVQKNSTNRVYSAQCVICSYKFAKEHNIPFASDI